MKLSILAGATSQSANVWVQDSSSTTGAGLTGLVFNTSGLTAYYSFTGANATATAITLATLAAVNSAYSSGGFKEIDATNMPGWYRLDIPNAALATSKGRVVSIHLKGATNMAPCPIEIELTGWDNQNATTGGLGNLDAAVSAVKAKTDSLTFTVAGMVDSNVVDWKGATAPAMTGDAYARLGAPAGASVSADVAAVKTDTAAVKTKTDSLTFTVAGMVDSNVVDWKGATAPAMTGDAFARLGAPAGVSVSADVAAVNAKTTNLPGSPAAVGSAMTLTSGERSSVADALLDRDMSTGTDSGSTTVRTARQALRALRNKISIATGTMTITKEDDATASWTAVVTTDATANPITAIDPAGP